MQTTSLKSAAKRAAKYRVLAPLQYLAREVRSNFAHRNLKVRLLLVSDFDCYTSDQQYAPFIRYREEIEEKLHLVTLTTDLNGASGLLKLAGGHFNAIGLKFSFRTSKKFALEFVQLVRSIAPHLRIIYFDGDDDLAVQWPEIISGCDLYVKKHMYHDMALYGQKTVGKTNLTDYVHHRHGFDFSDDIIPENSPFPPELSRKMRVGWNIALDDKIEVLRTEVLPTPVGSRQVDIVCRATVNPESWLFHLRKSITPALEPLKKEFNIITPVHRVAQDVYYQEMLSAKICISPFGYGEICWRDFEAILCGCLIVKPDMSHVQTEPDLFVPYETYIPVSWDYSDLAGKCEQYLNDPKECERISTNARLKLLDYYDRKLFLTSLENIVNQAGISK